ncbi:MAG TPA: hypothetical protein VGG89_14445 [Candidatus Baltobacteraceae bacterium]|jgi:hypothetical protein
MRPAVAQAIAEDEVQNAIASGVFTGEFRLHVWTFPMLVIDVASVSREMRFRLRVDFTDYDAQPVQLRLVNEDRIEIFDPFPLRNGQPFPNHQPAQLPQFFCITGTRDYYTHQGHNPQAGGPSWETHRQAHPARVVLHEVAHKFASGEWS